MQQSQTWRQCEILRLYLKEFSIARVEIVCKNFVIVVSRCDSVSIAIRLQVGREEFDSRRGLGIFLFASSSRPALGSTQPPVQRIGG
jgi:hypothetical protein